jgi:hypothetical protein
MYKASIRNYKLFEEASTAPYNYDWDNPDCPGCSQFILDCMADGLPWFHCYNELLNVIEDPEYKPNQNPVQYWPDSGHHPTEIHDLIPGLQWKYPQSIPVEDRIPRSY